MTEAGDWRPDSGTLPIAGGRSTLSKRDGRRGTGYHWRHRSPADSTGWSRHNPVDIRFDSGALDTIAGGRLYVLVTYAGNPFRRLAQRTAELAGKP